MNTAIKELVDSTLNKEIAAQTVAIFEELEGQDLYENIDRNGQ